MNIKERAHLIYSTLEATYPNAKCGLNYNNCFELLIATILSAQCTDIMVNKVTPHLFSQYPDPEKLKNAKAHDVEKIIKPTGFYQNKTKNIIAASNMIREKFEGIIPDKMQDLVKLPGVGRKTANVVLSNWFNKHIGIVVDTHVSRICQLLKLTSNTRPDKIEEDLIKLFPKQTWGQLSHLLINHGRAICIARKPKCLECSINKYCHFFIQSSAKPNRKIKKSRQKNLKHENNDH